MLIRSFGLFWRASEIDWNPGKGKRDEFRLLGRQGQNSPGLKLADFRQQQGIYVLYGNYGPYYVGLTRKQGLGKRLKDHLSDKHEGQWDRFSWFGFCGTLNRSKATGLCPLKALANVSVGSPSQAIADMEALLIKAMGTTNTADMNFQKASVWHQVERDEVEYYARKVGAW
jgi:hypothetical protein